MTEVSKYKTVKSLSEGLYKEKGSKFIAYAVQCYSEKEAKEYLSKWHKEHHQARHVCYAYRFGVGKHVFRANDDGEPSNSAGAPILGQIKAFDLSNILIGVVRYFGGTKLGVGGLITAYKSAAKDALENAEIIELEVYNWIKLSFNYEDMPMIMSMLKKYNLEMHTNDFSLKCELTTNLPLNLSEIIIKELNSAESVDIVPLGIY